MMRENWLIVGEDSRLKELAKLLCQAHRTIYYRKTNNWDQELNKLVAEFQPNYIVLPILPLATTMEYLPDISKSTIFAGRLNEQWQQLLQTTKPIRYLEHEGFIWENAYLTAEGFLATFYEKEKRLIKGQRFVISGFGRVGKMLAATLTKLGAEICIVARSIEHISEAKAYGYEACAMEQYERKVEHEYLLNTIPAQWLSDDQLTRYPHHIYDLASAPGCLNTEQHELVHYELLPGLPGKYFAEDAARVLWQTIEEELTIC